MRQKVEDASEAEAESKSERRGIRGFPLQARVIIRRRNLFNIRLVYSLVSTGLAFLRNSKLPWHQRNRLRFMPA